MLDKILLDDGAGGYGPFRGWIYSRFSGLIRSSVFRTT